MSFTKAEFRGAMLVLLDGSSTEAPLRTCSMCKKPLLRVFITAGARRRAPGLPEHQDCCITKDWVAGMPCPLALKSANLIEQLMEASRA